jgi:hypothetical protein
MLTRSLETSAHPTGRRRSRLAPLGWRLLARRLTVARSRSLQVQDRVDAARARHLHRHVYGRRDA